MNWFKFFVLSLILASPISGYAGGLFIENTDILSSNFLTSPYDLRDRSSYIQVTNVTEETILIHVQIFQHDRDCDEINFNDTLTANDTVVYDLDNIIRNDGSAVPANLLDDSSGYVVITVDNGDATFTANYESADAWFSVGHIIGNVRIIDVAGYEYRTNMAGLSDDIEDTLYANFNTIDNAMYADIIAYAFGLILVEDMEPVFNYSTTAINLDFGVEADIFVFDMKEEPLSCDRRNFACGNIMNYGVNEDYPNSKGGSLLCPGGGLADPMGGFIQFANSIIPVPPMFELADPVFSSGFIGINNGDGTGSFDTWYKRDGEIF